MGLGIFNKEELAEVESLVKVLPVMEVSARAYVEGEKEIT